MVDFNIGVTWASLPIMTIHPQVAQNPEYRDYRRLFTTQDEWTMVRYVIEVLRPVGYWTLWMSSHDTVTLHHVINVYKDMFDHMYGVMRALPMKITQWNKDIWFAMKFTQQKLPKYYADDTPRTGLVHISAQTIDPFRKLWLFGKWGNGMTTNPEVKTSYTTQYQVAFLKCLENEYCAKHRPLPVIQPESVTYNNVFPSAMASRSGQSSYDAYDLSSNDKEYLMPKDVAEMTPGRIDYEARVFTTPRLYLHSPPELPQNWGLINLNNN